MVKTKGSLPMAMKPADQRQRTNSRASLVVLPPAPDVKAPPLPHGYVPAVRKAWAAFWRRSAVGQAVDRESDMPALLRWAWCLNEIATIGPVLEKSRLITSPNGQPILNPLFSMLKALMAEADHLEIEFGMTSLARSRLSLTIGQSKLTAAELNKRLEAKAPELVLDGEWQEV